MSSAPNATISIFKHETLFQLIPAAATVTSTSVASNLLSYRTASLAYIRIRLQTTCFKSLSYYNGKCKIYLQDLLSTTKIFANWANWHLQRD